MIKPPKISVIVPVYNVDKYLRRCIDSILIQGFTNFELILIDDGSIDNSSAICDEYAAKDARVRVFHKENGGVSLARNIGIDNAVGEWITFVDSDDWIDNNYLSSLLGDEKFDLSICNLKVEESSFNWEVVIEEGIHYKVFIERLFEKGKFTGFPFLGPCCKLFRKGIIDKYNIRYRENISSGEDSLFVLDFFCHIDNYFGVNKMLYHYWQPGNGLSGQKILAYNFILFAEEANLILDVLSIKYNFDKDKFLACFLWGGFNAYLRYVIVKEKMNKEQIQKLYTIFPYKYYLNYVSKFGKLMKLSAIFYKYKLFDLFVLYLKMLKYINHPFFKIV